MAYVLILEDMDSDAHEVASALNQIGSYELERFKAASLAIEFLSDKLTANSELPTLMVVDLNLPQSSGYELLRFYHATPQIHSVPCAVWSVMDQELDKKLTTWLGSRKLISKNSGPATLRKSLASLLKENATSSGSEKPAAKSKSEREAAPRPPKRA